MKKYSSQFGILIIKCKKGNTFSRYVFHMNGSVEVAKLFISQFCGKCINTCRFYVR